MLAFYLSLIDTEEDRIKFEELYYKYRDSLYSIAVGIIKDDQLAKEALSKALESIANHIHKIETHNPARLQNYVFKIVKNSCFNILKSKHSRSTVYSLDDFPETAASEDLIETLIADERYKQIVSVIYSMPEIYRDVLSMHYIYDYKNDFIAEVLSRPLATVRSQLQRGTKILKEKLREAKLYDKK